ncbi:hypothetical protein HID58_070071, partial [Brassica napus]
IRPSSSLPATEIEAPFLLSFVDVDAGSDLASRRRLRPSPLMPRFNSASLSIAAAVPFISAVTAAPFVSDATAALFVSTITTTVSNRLGSSVLLKSTISYAVRLSGDSRKAMSSGCADCSGSPPDAPPFSIVGHLDAAGDFPQPYTTVRWLVFGLLMISFWARLTMITADIISSRLSSGKHSSKMDMVALILAKSQRISGGFIGPFKLRIMIYLLLMKCFPLDSSGTSWLLVLPSSHKEWISYLLSMKGYTFSVLLLSSGFSFSTGLSSCVAVSTGPEEATEITFGFLVGESWLSTSHYVTIFQLDVKVLYAHSRFVSNSLSSFYEGLSHLSFNQRRCLTSSSYCTRAS